MRCFKLIAVAVCGAFCHGVFAQPEVLDKSAAPTVSRLGINSDDYPAAAQQKHKGIRLFLAFDSSGKAYRCDIVASSGVPELDTQTCAIFMRKQTYRPAKDQTGAVVPSEFSVGVSWGVEPASPYDGTILIEQLPDKKPALSFAVRQVIDANGRVEFCAIDRLSGVAALDRQACQLASGVFPERPLKGPDNKSIRGLRLLRIAVVADKNDGGSREP